VNRPLVSRIWLCRLSYPLRSCEQFTKIPVVLRTAMHSIHSGGRHPRENYRALLRASWAVRFPIIASSVVVP